MDADCVVPELLRSVSRGQAYLALRHLVEAGESSVESIHLSVGGSLPAVQILMVQLYRQGLVKRRKAGDPGDPPGWRKPGRKPYLYSACRQLARWMRQTDLMAGALKGGAA